MQCRMALTPASVRKPFKRVEGILKKHSQKLGPDAEVAMLALCIASAQVIGKASLRARLRLHPWCVLCV